MNELDALVEDDSEVETPEETPEPTQEVTGETDTGSTPEPDSSQEWTKAAVLDERQKRQALEQELASIRAAKEAPARPDVFEDPDGAFAHLEANFNQRLLNQRINLSRDTMAMLKDDYPEMESAFVDMARDDPALTQQMLAASNPARFAYETAKKHAKWKEIQDVDAYKEKIRQEVLAEMGTKPKGNVNLATVTATGGSEVPTDESLEAILGR